MVYTRNKKMQQEYAASQKMATCFANVKDRRYEIFFARNFEGKLNVTTKEVPMLGRIMDGRRATAVKGQFKLTIYRLTDMFSEIVLEYLNTGVLPTFDIQVTEEDPATPMGRSTKIYSGCMIDGDVLLSVFNDTGDFIEQTVEGYFFDVSMPEKYTDPAGM